MGGSDMALVVFLRGINVGGHRRFRSSIFAKELKDYEVVNVGAAGTFVVRKPGSRTQFHAELVRRLPFKADVALCDGRDLISLQAHNPFETEPSRSDIVRFVCIFSRAARVSANFPIAIPEDRKWLVRILGSNKQFVFGEYRRHMKAIGYLGQLDQRFGAPATTRNWNTILTIAQILKNKTRR